ncbi:hypothetical protein BOTBODRAFT_169225 [Botryobasidium botryosum FD-172 SS1]|uniref:DUF605-domain-containing protein n=1 Tax=Botryobasidium botryosum (strain FD-172 SS1) TaxID=930990 RepID=A0A067N0J8_BOTB1|nr:hypothetical protein BOTBODRAFT_169225 [Botryobasidium botryosum FD-172 SS1]
MAVPSHGSKPTVILGLPEIPPNMKNLLPYLQRAAELKDKDPVMCHWCLRFAVKLGIAGMSKPSTAPQKAFLQELFNVLENPAKPMTREQDELLTDSAGSMYIRKFAYKVFAQADNEDRKGGATRSTAKRFLAAANFLELLTMFDEPEDGVTEGKIRYAKWKAAEIAKAYREGRVPVPGPASTGVVSPDLLSPNGYESRDKDSSNNSNSGYFNNNLSTPLLSTAGDSTFGSVPTSIEPSPSPSQLPLPSSPAPTPPPPSDPATPLATRTNIYSSPPIRPVSDANDGAFSSPFPSHLRNLSSSGTWSTAATPGVEDKFRRQALNLSQPSPTPARAIAQRGYPFYGNDNDRREKGPDSADAEMEDNEEARKDRWQAALAAFGGSVPARSGSWSSIATVGENMSRSGSLGAPVAPVRPIDPDGRSGLPFGSSAQILKGIPEVPAVPIIDYRRSREGSRDSREDGDELAPLPTLPIPIKKVHFSPSVTGGMSSIASSSPPGSPSSYAESTVSPLEIALSPQSSHTTNLSDISGPPKSPGGYGGYVPGSKPSPPAKPAHLSNSPRSYSPPKGPEPPTSSSRSSPPGSAATYHVTNYYSSPRSSPPLKTSPTQSPAALTPRPLTTPLSKDRASPPRRPFTMPSAPPGSSPRHSPHASAPPLPSPYGNSYNPSPPRRLSPPGRLSPPRRPSPPRPLPTFLPHEIVEQTKRHARFAMSALDYDDLDTARKELQLALDYVNGRITGPR